MKKCFVIAYDIGTTGNKTCLYELQSGAIRFVAEASGKYKLDLSDDGFAEQSPDDWWASMCSTTREVLRSAGIGSNDISAISFCSQMQCLILTDREGNALYPAISYMDKRATREFREFGKGLISVAGVEVKKLIVSLTETGVVAASAKDPVFKYRYMKDNFPEMYKKVYKWLDAKDYLIMRATGRFTMTEDSAFATMVYSCKKKAWSESVCRLHGVDTAHLPELVRSTDVVGYLTQKAAEELSLSTECKVFAGGGDSSLIGVGAGCTKVGQTHVYMGTSGWVSTVVDKQLVDVSYMIASVAGVSEGKYNYFAEMETSGKCLEWLRDNIVLDKVGIYEEKSESDDIIGRICSIAAKAEPGSGGVIFVPWILGNSCPFEDADCCAGFFNVGIKTTKAELCRAVIEGALFHKRWMLESEEKKTKTSRVIRMAGGGARSEIICQMLADITGREVEVVENPQNAGAAGAAVVMASGLGLISSLDDAAGVVSLRARYIPDPKKKARYDKSFEVFKRLYPKNRKNYKLMNRATNKRAALEIRDAQ